MIRISIEVEPHWITQMQISCSGGRWVPWKSGKNKRYMLYQLLKATGFTERQDIPNIPGIYQVNTMYILKIYLILLVIYHIVAMCLAPSHVKLKIDQFSMQNITWANTAYFCIFTAVLGISNGITGSLSCTSSPVGEKGSELCAAALHHDKEVSPSFLRSRWPSMFWSATSTGRTWTGSRPSSPAARLVR
jgi:hypothetical protein